MAKRTGARGSWAARSGRALCSAAVVLAVLLGSGRPSLAASVTSTLGPVPPLPSSGNGADVTVQVWYGTYTSNPIPTALRFTTASEIRMRLDSAASQATIESFTLDAGTVRVAGFPLHEVQLVTVFSPPTTFPFDPVTGEFATTLYPYLTADIPGYGTVPLASGSLDLAGTFSYQGSVESGPVTMSLEATGNLSFAFYYLVTVDIRGPLSIRFGSTAPGYPDGALEGRVAVAAGARGGRVAGAWVGNFGEETTARTDGSFGFGEWPRQFDPTWLYGGMECGSTWMLGSSPRAALASGGTTHAGDVVLVGEPGSFAAEPGFVVAPRTTELVAMAFDQLTSPMLVAAIRHTDGSQRLAFFKNTSGTLLLKSEIGAQGDIRRDLLVSRGFQQPVVFYPNVTEEAVSVVWPGSNLTTIAGPIHIPAGGPAVALRVANVTKPEGPDLLVAVEDAGTGAGRVVRIPSITPGQWDVPQLVYSSAGPIHAIEARPLDGDGFDDLVVAEADSGSCKVFLSSGPASFSESQTVACPRDARGAIAQDLDGDGDWDMAFAGDADAGGAGRVTVLRNGSGSLTPIQVDVGRDLSSIDSASWIVAGRRAFVVASPGDDSVYVVAEDGQGGFAAAGGVSGAGAISVAAQDVNDDGFDDLVAATGATTLARWTNVLVPGDGDGDGLDDGTELATDLDCGDPDSDGDGFLDGSDLCPALAGVGQADGDGDGVGDACDNCVAAFNADQADSDEDGIGDACEGGAVSRRYTPEAGKTNQLTLSLGNFLGALETKTAQVLPSSFIDLEFDPVANHVVLQDLEIAFSELHYFGLLNIALIQPRIVLASSGGPRDVAVDPATGAFSFDLLVVGLDVLVGTQPQLPGGLFTIGGKVSADGRRLQDVYVGFATTPITAFLGPYYLVGPGTLNFIAP